MKNLITLTTLGILLLTACSKEEIETPITEQTFESAFVLSQSLEGEANLESTNIDLLDAKLGSTRAGITSETIHTSGYYKNTRRDFTMITWTGTQSGRALLGEAEVKMISPSGSFHFLLRTTCVTVNGDEAVYGGEVTEVLVATGKADFLVKGWKFYFKVIDYGRGGGGINDMISNNMLLVSPDARAMCGISPSNRIWDSKGYTAVELPGYVNVE